MKKKFYSIAAIAISLAIFTACDSATQIPSPKSVMEISTRVADWQIEHFEDQADFRAPRGTTHHDNKYHDLQWQNGALYAGLYQFSEISPSDKYKNWLIQMGNEHKWHLHTRMYHADDHVVGQFYLKLAKELNNKEMYEPTMMQFDSIMVSPRANDWLWNWCDALFMAPPVWAYLSEITNDAAYLEFMDKHFHMTYEQLWDKDDHLFYRDMKYLDRQEKNGAKIFWSRGNGWVFGGLALMIPHLPEDWAGRQFYIDTFKQMAAKIKDIQREDGSWSAGLLGDIKDYPTIETSGSSFFTFGLAWGINNGYLDRETYEPTLLKAWDTMSNAVNKDGMLTYVQGVGASPGASFAEYTEVYGSGAFLAAGAEMYRYATLHK